MRRMNAATGSALALLLAAAAGAEAQGVADAPFGYIDFGVRATSFAGDQARAQRFHDLGDGVVMERLRFEREGADWLFAASADHVGRRDQRYFAEYRVGGRIKMTFTWDQVPLFFSGDTRTLYTAKDGVLRLDDSMRGAIEAGAARLADFAPGARRFDLDSRRDTAAFNLLVSPTRDVNVKFDLKTVRREGELPWMASFGFSNAIEVPAPLDTRTTDVRASAEWMNRRGSLRIGYDGSWFDNRVSTLIWDNPLKVTDSTFPTAYSAGTGGATGRYALWPSSTLHSVATAGSLKLPGRSRATANVTVGTWRQDEKLLPFTINSAIPTIPLPRNTTDGDIRTLAMNYTLTSRPSRYVWINARYRYYDFNNRTSHFAVHEYVRLDQVQYDLHSGGSEYVSFTRKNIDLDASFTPAPHTALRIGYGRDEADRTHRMFELTTDNVFRTSLDVGGNRYVTFRTIYERSTREGEGFELEHLIESGEQPAMRHFDIANRDRDRVTALVILTPLPSVGLTASVAAGNDDYKDSGFGLRDNDNRAWSLSLDLTPGERVAAGLSYVDEKYSALQRSRNASPGPQFSDPTRDWSIDTTDEAHNVTASLDLVRLLPSTDLRFAYGVNWSRATYFYGVPANSTLVAPLQLPPVKNELQNGRIDLRYFLTSRVAVGFVYWFDKYRVDDFALGPQTLSRLDLPGSLFLGYTYRPYTMHAGWLRLTYLW